jgi:hypothetical protein
MTGKMIPISSSKSVSRLLTVSGFFRDLQKTNDLQKTKNKRCLTIIETPQVFTPFDVIDVTNQLSRRCFDLILIGIKPQAGLDPILQLEREVLVSLLQLMETVYQENFWKSLAFVFFKDSQNRGEVGNIKHFLFGISFFCRYILEQLRFVKRINLYLI